MPIVFSGEGAGTGGLSWGQEELWQKMRAKRTWLPIGSIDPLPAGTTLEHAVADLRFVMDSYPSMRTRLVLDAAAPRQVVANRGEITLEVVDADDDDDPFRLASRAWWRYCRTDYQFTSEWPVRMAVIRHRGVLTHRVWTMCHLVTDGGGGLVILDELAAHDNSRSRAAPAPLALAQWQQSPAGQGQSASALRYWDANLRRVRAARFTTPPPISPRYWQGRSESVAMHLATRLIAARTGLGSSSVLLALFAAAMARTTGANPVVIQLTVDNRFRPRIGRSVSPLMQNGLCVIDVPTSTVDDAVRQAQRRAMTAYKHAYYHPGQRGDLLARHSLERGEPIDLGCHFNDRRLATRDLTGPLPTLAQIQDALHESSFNWLYKQDEMVFDDVYFNVEDIADRIMITVTADVHYVSPEDIATCLVTMEELAVAAARDPQTATGAPAADAG